ncbi:hypothetical protein D3C85_1814740 [compost metagenome]
MIGMAGDEMLVAALTDAIVLNPGPRATVQAHSLARLLAHLQFLPEHYLRIEVVDHADGLLR